MKLFTLLGLLFFTGLAATAAAAAAPLEAGAEAPRLTVTTDEGEPLDLAEVYERGPTLVYFYPKSFTGGCTAQACNIRDNFGSVREAGITVLGVSRDGVETQARFREEEALPFTLIADEDGALGRAFQVASHGDTVYQRQSFLVVDGKVVWRDLSASPTSQSADVLAALREVRSAGDGA